MSESAEARDVMSLPKKAYRTTHVSVRKTLQTTLEHVKVDKARTNKHKVTDGTCLKYFLEVNRGGPGSSVKTSARSYRTQYI
mmetsp:Transcript_49401/g.59846  ORF Transcript_49401/g.59846 Transcript_49401/m.59846 type:complete len:82 (+) Transcript_49401:7-252(+)